MNGTHGRHKTTHFTLKPLFFLVLDTKKFQRFYATLIGKTCFLHNNNLNPNLYQLSTDSFQLINPEKTTSIENFSILPPIKFISLIAVLTIKMERSSLQ